MNDIYDYPQRIARYRRAIAKFGENGQLALRFLDHITSQCLSQARISKTASHIPALLRLINFRLADATRADVERVVAAIHANQRWREWTKHDKKLILRKLVQYAKHGCCTRETPMPPEVAWIKLSLKAKDERVTPERLLTQKDFEAMLKAADNSRDRAMLYVLFEGALRPGELLSMRVASVKFKQAETACVENGAVVKEKVNYCLISVNGKTGLKVLPLVASHRPLLDWIEEHPYSAEPDAPLWCSIAHNYKGRRLTYRHFREIIKRTAKHAGIGKAVWPYLFRHTTLTQLAKTFTEAKLERYAGWVHGSKMSARYVHFSARDLEEAVLELYGKKPISETSGVVSLVKCSRCGRESPTGMVYCGFCGLALDRQFALDLERQKEDEIAELKRQFRQMQETMTKLLASQQPLSQLLAQIAASTQANPQAASTAPQQAPQTSHSPQTQFHSHKKQQQMKESQRRSAFHG
ncbi:MAG: tyrosine-type recombinase/integrase [Candidatus Bathyarchaeales archaeon]